MKRREVLAFAGLGFAAFCWGSATTITKYALDSFGPMTLLFVELAAANIALWAVLIVRGVHRPQGMARVLIVGILEPGLCEAFIAVGLTSTSAANAAILSAPEALFTVLLAAIFLKERLTPKLMLAALIALGGVLILEFTGGFDGTHIGDLLVLAGILSASCYSIVARTIAPDNDALTMTAFQFAVSLVFITPFAAYQWATGAESIDTRRVDPIIRVKDINYPKLLGFSPTRVPEFIASTAAICSSVRLKSKTEKFSASRSTLLDIGNTILPDCKCQRMTT